MLEESLTIAQESGDRDSIANQIYNIAAVLVEQGDLNGASLMLGQARAIWSENGNRTALAYALSTLGEIALARGDLPAARQMHQQALSIRRELGEKVSAAESQLSLATLAQEEGHADVALRDAQTTAEVFRTNKAPDDEVAADLLEAEVLLSQNKSADAGKAIDQAKSLAAATQNPRARLSTAILAARLHAGSDANEALKSLLQTASEAKKLGLLAIEYEARLAQGEMESRSAYPAAGRERLSYLERDARATGFGLIAEKANRSVRRARE